MYNLLVASGFVSLVIAVLLFLSEHPVKGVLMIGAGGILMVLAIWVESSKEHSVQRLTVGKRPQTVRVRRLP